MGRRAVTCPICLGKGRIPNPYGTTVAEIPCHGCGGLGWIQIGDDNIVNECPIMKGGGCFYGCCSNCPYYRESFYAYPYTIHISA